MSEWISVKDRLPEENTNVLTYEWNDIDLCSLWVYSDGSYAFMNGEGICRGVTHWMPLPEAPHE